MDPLSKYRKVSSYKEFPTRGTFIVITRSKSFLGKAIQYFMGVWQWIRGEEKPERYPNHADGVYDGSAIGALKLGVRLNPLSRHFQKKHSPEFWLIKPVFNRLEEEKFWLFLMQQVKEPYAYFDLFKYILRSIRQKWPGVKEPLDRDKWTCFSLIASACNHAWGRTVFPDPYKISPVEFCDIVDGANGYLFTNAN